LIPTARATTEPPGGVENANLEQFDAAAARVWSKGYGAAGKSIFSNITALIPEATGWPVHYPAGWGGCSSEDKGIVDYIREISSKAKACPNMKFVMGGHSQGGVVTVRTIAQMPKDLMDKVIAITMVGSPNCPASVKDKCRSYCNSGDGVSHVPPVHVSDSYHDDQICSSEGNSLSKGKCTTVAVKGSVVDVMTVPDNSEVIPHYRRGLEISGALSPADCNREEVAEKNHKAKGSGSSHMLYNSDGHFPPAAACYVYKKYMAAKGQ
jgi:hypothetical protein